MPTNPPSPGRPGPERFTMLSAAPTNLTDEQRSWRVVEPEVNPGERLTVIELGEPVPVGDDALRGRLAALSGQDRQVFTLHCFDGQSHGAIAKQLGITRAAVAASVRRSREQLRAAFA